MSDTPWLNGEFILKGWLYAHSSVFQYIGHLLDFLGKHYLEDVFATHDLPKYQSYGVYPKMDIRMDVNIEPDLKSKDYRDPVKWLDNFEIQPENLAGLQQIVQQSNDNTQVIVIEMPFYKTAYTFLPNGKQDYATYTRQVDSITAPAYVPFGGWTNNLPSPRTFDGITSTSTWRVPTNSDNGPVSNSPTSTCKVN